MLRKALAEALAHAFPSRVELAQMLLGMDVDQSEIPHGENHQEVVYKLVMKMDGQGRIGELFKSAVLANPGNPRMNALLEEITQLPIPIQGQIVRGEHRFGVQELPQEGWDMDVLRRLDELSSQMAEIKTTLALQAQSREWDTRSGNERNQLLIKEIEALREGQRATRLEVAAVKEWQKAIQQEIAVINEWRRANTAVREMRYPQSYVRFAIAVVGILILAAAIIIYFQIWGVPAWLGG